MTHTPTPWMEHVETVLRNGGVHPDKRALIVRAVNNFEDLKTCVRAAVNMVDGNGAPPDWDFLRQVLRSAESNQ